VKPSTDDERTALDVAAITVHWMARQWSRAAPGVAARLRAIADRLSERAARLRAQEHEAALRSEDPLDMPLDPFNVEDPTEKVTTPYGTASEEPRKKS
jgi:hypothetical protein